MRGKLFATHSKVFSTRGKVKNICPTWQTICHEWQTIYHAWQMFHLCSFLFVYLLQIKKHICHVTRGNCFIYIFLGVDIDEKLKWDIHINMVKKRISKFFFAINKAKHVMDRHHLQTLCYSLVYPYVLYGITVWGSTYHAYLSKLVMMQKKIIRIITGAKYDAHAEPLFKTAKLLKLDDIYRLQIRKYMFCYIHNTLPKSLNKLFSLSNETHTHVTRYHTTFKLTVNKTRTITVTTLMWVTARYAHPAWRTPLQVRVYFKPTQSGAPEGPADSTGRTVSHAGKEEGYSDPGNGSHRTAVFVSSTPGARQSSADGGNRASSVGGDVSPRRGWKRSSENEDDENLAGLRGSVSAEEEAEKLSNKEDCVTPTSGRSESHGAASPAALCLEPVVRRTACPC